MITENDIHVLDLRKIILSKPSSLPITDEYEGHKPIEIRTAWYSSQKEHLAGWLLEYNSSGAYNRTTPSISSKRFYNRFQCAAGLLWLAEALGENTDVLKKAVIAINQAGNRTASRCAAFRKVVPWTRLYELIQDHLKFIQSLKKTTDATATSAKGKYSKF